MKLSAVKATRDCVKTRFNICRLLLVIKLIHAHKQTDRQTNRQTDRDDRQTDRQTDRQRWQTLLLITASLKLRVLCTCKWQPSRSAHKSDVCRWLTYNDAAGVCAINTALFYCTKRDTCRQGDEISARILDQQQRRWWYGCLVTSCLYTVCTTEGTRSHVVH